MATEHWYGLKIRRGFELLVAQRLQKLHAGVFVAERDSVMPQQPHQQAKQSAVCIYSRFDLRLRASIVAIPGVLDIAGTPKPTRCDTEVSGILRNALRLLSF